MFNSQRAGWLPAGGGGGGGGGRQNGTLKAQVLAASAQANSGCAKPASLSSKQPAEDLESFLGPWPQREPPHQNHRQARHMPPAAKAAGRAARHAAAGSQASFLTSTSATASAAGERGDCDDHDHDHDHDHDEQDECLKRLHKTTTGAGGEPAPLAAADLRKTASARVRRGLARAKSLLAARYARAAAAKPAGSRLDKLAVAARRAALVAAVFLALNLIVYFWPIDARRRIEPKVAAARTRPKFAGALAVNGKLDELGEKLFEGQFHAPESMAWTANKRAFFTGVEGGFILLVEPYAERWTVAARLNARGAVEDKSGRVRFDQAQQRQHDGGPEAAGGSPPVDSPPPPPLVPFCTRDVELYGPRAEFEPSLVRLSRCSRPLGIRLAPNGTHLYVMDALSGLYRVDLAADLAAALANQARPLAEANRVSKLLDFTRAFGRKPTGTSGNQEEEAAEHHQDQDGQLVGRPVRPEQVYFGDDIAVEWAAADADAPESPSDVVYMTDCSRRWPLRYLLWLMLENDDSGRVLRLDVRAGRLSELAAVVPVRAQSARPAGHADDDDPRGLSFPNGIELTANKSALLISDLNNRRILMHHLRGPLAGTTRLVMWVPGYSDNIRRGLDSPDGTPTYWFACGCAVGDGRYEIAEFVNGLPQVKRLFLRWLHVFGSATSLVGRLTGSTLLKDAGLIIGSAWLTVDPYCTHGLVAQFNEQGDILRSLHGPTFGSNFKLLSEAHQVPLLEFGGGGGGELAQNATAPSNANNARSLLFLGSVYYPYLGRLELAPHHQHEPQPTRLAD